MMDKVPKPAVVTLPEELRLVARGSFVQLVNALDDGAGPQARSYANSAPSESGWRCTVSSCWQVKGCWPTG